MMFSTRKARALALSLSLAACAPPPAPVCTAVPGVLEGERRVTGRDLPALVWPAAAGGEVRLVDHHAPCAPPGALVVLRQLAVWSAPSRWHAAHTAELAALPDVAVIDLWSADEDGLPIASGASLAGLYDVAPDAVALDPDETLAPRAIAGVALPLVAIVDARTLHVERVMPDPRAGDVELAVRSIAARLRGEAPPPPPPDDLVDGRFSRDRWDLVLDMVRPSPPPPSPTNAVADDPRAAALGHALFEDPGLSPTGVSCARCHDVSMGFGDGLARGRGVAEVGRNTPTLWGAASARWPFWDGRVDSLWAQALGPIESAREMGGSRLEVAHRVALAHRAPFEALFGPLPPLEDAGRFPARGMPGEPAWEAMAPADRDAVTRVFTDVGKALEAYERTLPLPESPLTAYAAGDHEALAPEVRDGLLRYFEAGCAQCHAGPHLTNGAFFSIAMPGAGEGADVDVGREGAQVALATSPFRAQGAYSDAPDTPDPLAGRDAFPASTRGAFRTPTLRGLRLTAPYGHAGTFTTLRDVVEHYSKVRSLDPDPRVAAGPDPHLREFDAHHIDQIVRFLEIL